MSLKMPLEDALETYIAASYFAASKVFTQRGFEKPELLKNKAIRAEFVVKYLLNWDACKTIVIKILKKDVSDDRIEKVYCKLSACIKSSLSEPVGDPEKYRNNLVLTIKNKIKEMTSVGELLSSKA